MSPFHFSPELLISPLLLVGADSDKVGERTVSRKLSCSRAKKHTSSAFPVAITPSSFFLIAVSDRCLITFTFRPFRCPSDAFSRLHGLAPSPARLSPLIVFAKLFPSSARHCRHVRCRRTSSRRYVLMVPHVSLRRPRYGFCFGMQTKRSAKENLCVLPQKLPFRTSVSHFRLRIQSKRSS